MSQGKNNSSTPSFLFIRLMGILLLLSTWSQNAVSQDDFKVKWWYVLTGPAEPAVADYYPVAKQVLESRYQSEVARLSVPSYNPKVISAGFVPDPMYCSVNKLGSDFGSVDCWINFTFTTYLYDNLGNVTLWPRNGRVQLRFHPRCYSTANGVTTSKIASFGDTTTWQPPYCSKTACPVGKDCKTKTDPGPRSCNPISFTTGNKFLIESDFAGQNMGLNRTYHAKSGELSPILLQGVGVPATGVTSLAWKHSYQRSIRTTSTTPVWASRPDGSLYTYQLVSGVWVGEADNVNRLTELKDTAGVRTGWTYYNTKSEDTEIYDVSGKLLTIQSKSGLTQTLIYSDGSNSAISGGILLNSNGSPSTSAIPLGLLVRVKDDNGRTIEFGYDINNYRLMQITDPAGGTIKYGYDGVSSIVLSGQAPGNNLTSVTYQDGRVRQYWYNEQDKTSNTNLPSALTGITDENSVRYASYWYDAQGRAYKEELAPNLALNIEKNELVYNTDASGNPTTTVVTDSRGSARTYNFTTILGVVKSTGQSQPAGSGCAASAAALTYDVNGNVASRTDFKGNKTTYAYDMARNLETSRTEGLTATNAVTPATRTITSSYHPIWRLPLVITEYNGGTANLSNGSGAPTGTALRSTSTVYDTRGNITSITEADPVRSTSRTTSMTYTYSSAVPGLVLTKVVDGPRTDVNDISTYTYYPHDATCTPSSATPIIDPITNTSPANLGCRGQLSSMSNALNQTSTYDRYNHHGQVEQMTDANGLVTSSTYDLRQRPLSRTTGTETTSLTYDGVGQVTQLTLPDASQLNYTYDAAHRLTDVQDSLGNKVHYTLDSEGNRTNEATTDPLNALTKTLSRSYDALNRLQQVTGVE